MLLLRFWAEVDYIEHALPTTGIRFVRTLSNFCQSLFLPDQQGYALILKEYFYFILLKVILCKIAKPT